MDKIYLGNTKIQKNGRMVIPKKAREILNIDTGDQVVLEHHEDGTLRLRKA